jgi:hypothetical protein
MCPCGSGLPIRSCCGALANTVPPGPRTGYSNPKCYASALEDCSEGISGEHFISAAVLKLLSDESFQVSDVAWLPDGGSAILRVSSLKSNVLCRRHNIALTTLDTVARDFFGFLMSYDGTSAQILIPGLDIERWLLKVLCGLLSSRVSQFAGETVPRLEPTLDMLRTLFLAVPFPQDHGLAYVCIDEEDSPTLQVAFRPLIDARCKTVVGLDFRAWYLRFLLCLVPVETCLPTDESRFGLCFRPSRITLSRGSGSRSVHLWGFNGPPVDVRIDAPLRTSKPPHHRATIAGAD